MRRTGCNRLCDEQAIFLVEVFAQFCAQRCLKALSPRFGLMFERVRPPYCPIAPRKQSLTSLKLAGIRASHPSAVLGLQQLDPASEEYINDRWSQWSQLSAKQHLLLACYVLESQQRTLLARDPQPTVQTTSGKLPFPVHESLWNAETASQWIMIAQQQPHIPQTVHEALNQNTGERYSIFQYSVLIAACHDPFNGPSLSTDAIFDQLLSQSSTTQLQLLTSKLAQLVPMRELLAVSGEGWVLGTKLTSGEEFTTLRATLHTWTAQIWLSTAENEQNSAAEALRISVAILQLSLEPSKPLALGLGNELGLFFAVLVLWAATAAATSSYLASGVSSRHWQPSPMLDISLTSAPPSRITANTAVRSTSAGMIHSTEIQQSSDSITSERRSSIPWVEIFSNSSRFLLTALDDVATFQVAACQTGCSSLLLWAKMHLQGAFSYTSHSADVDPVSSGLHRGDIITDAINQIKRMLDHGWEGWGI